jgi:hypothetical protein
MTDPLGIDLPAALGLLLGPIELCVGRRFDHRGGPRLQDHRAHPITNGQVEFRNVEWQGRLAKAAAQLAAQLSASTCHGDF